MPVRQLIACLALVAVVAVRSLHAADAPSDDAVRAAVTGDSTPRVPEGFFTEPYFKETQTTRWMVYFATQTPRSRVMAHADSLADAREIVEAFVATLSKEGEPKIVGDKQTAQHYEIIVTTKRYKQDVTTHFRVSRSDYFVPTAAMPLAKPGIEGALDVGNFNGQQQDDNVADFAERFWWACFAWHKHVYALARPAITNTDSTIVARLPMATLNHIDNDADTITLQWFELRIDRDTGGVKRVTTTLRTISVSP